MEHPVLSEGASSAFTLQGYDLFVRRRRLWWYTPLPADSLLDISFSGCRLLLRSRVQPPEHLKVRISLPRLGDAVDLNGVVASVKMLPEELFEAGVSWSKLTPRDERLLAYWQKYFERRPPASLLRRPDMLL